MRLTTAISNRAAAVSQRLISCRSCPAAVDFEGEIYMRRERQGTLMATYEKACVPWSEKETPSAFGHEQLQPDDFAGAVLSKFLSLPVQSLLYRL